MKFQPRYSLISSVLPLLGALMVLIASPVTAQAQTGPDLKVTKVCVNGPMQSVLCTVTVTNQGTVASVSPLSLTDVVTGAPANALFTGGGGTLPISCSPGAGPVLPIACSANISILPNQSKTALFSFKLPTGGGFTNCATVTQGQAPGVPADPNPANNTNICTTVIATSSTTVPDLGVTKSCQVFTNSGQAPAATCTITVTNLNSTVPAILPIILKDTITGPNPAMLTGAGGTLNPSGPGPANVNGVLTTFTGNAPLAGGASGTMLISYNFPSGGGTYTNCATVSQAQPDPSPANNTNVCTTITVGGGGGGPITIVTPPPSGACVTQTVVSGLHYPTQSCSQSTPGFLAGMMTSFHFKSKCTAPNTLLGVTNVSCQNAPIPGFPTGSVYQGTACCGIVPPLLGSITIEKDAQPNDAQDFTFTPSVVTIPAFQLDDDPTNNTLANSKTITNLPAGSYTFTEGLVSGWNLASIVCTPSSGTTTNLTTRAATINLTAGANVTCKFTNVKLPQTATGTLTIVKVVQPAGNLQAFTFTSNVPGSIPPFQLDNNPGTGMIPSSKTFTNLPAGVPYTVTESAVSGWTTPSLQCLVAVPGSTTTFTDQLNRTFTVNLAAGANVTCTFINVNTWPSTAVVNIYNPMTPFGPQTVNISVGGTVTFNNVNSGAPWTITWLSGPSTFGPVPLPTSPSSGTTSPFTTPGTYTYTINGTPSFTLSGTIIVH